MTPADRKINISIDDSVLKKLALTIDEAAEKILKHDKFSQSGQNSGISTAAIFDTADRFLKISSNTGFNGKNSDEESIEEKTKKMLANFEAMLVNTQKILQTVGFIDDEINNLFSKIIQMVKSLSGGIDFLGSVVGFISNLFAPGSGSAAGGLMGIGDNVTAPAVPVPPAGNNTFSVHLNGRIIDDNLKREIAAKGIYLENLSVERNAYN